MLGKLLFIFALVSLSLQQAPTPKPVFSVDPAKLAGKWYKSVWFDGTGTLPANVNCYYTTFDYNETNIFGNDTIVIDGQTYNYPFVFTSLNDGNSQVMLDGYNTTYDFIEFNALYAILAGDTTQEAFVLARKPTQNQYLLDAQAYYMEQQGYQSNAQNTLYLYSQEC